MILFSADFQNGYPCVRIALASKLSRKELLKHLELNQRVSENFLIENIDKYLSVIMNNQKFDGKHKNISFSVEVKSI